MKTIVLARIFTTAAAAATTTTITALKQKPFHS
jgi:hypothetical protein